MWRKGIFLLSILLVACGGERTMAPPSGSTGGTNAGAGGTTGSGSTPAIRMLWIGNSYTYVNDLPALVASLARTANRSPLPVHTALLDGGQTLKGAYNRSDLAPTIARGWDYVVLQEQSTTPLTAPDTMRKYGALIAEAAHVMPPIGAQGLNMSLADLSALLDLAMGNPASLGSAEMLAAFERKRHLEVKARLAGVDLLNRTSMLGEPFLRDLRAGALNALYSLGPVRKTLMKAGLGVR